MLRTGKEEGINFSYGGKIGNTLNSHRLIAYAYQQGGAEKQNAMVDKLFNLYFECEQDIADMDVLIKAGEQVGLSNVREFLHSDALRAEVQKQIRQNQQEGITGVPHFTFNGQYAVSGAQNPETFVSIFKRLGIE